MGGIAGLIGSLAREVISHLIITSMFGNKYMTNYKLDLIMLIVSIIVTILASISVVSSMKLEKHSSMLMAE